MKNTFKLLTVALIMTLATQSFGMQRLMRFASAARTSFAQSKLAARSAFTNMRNSVASSRLFSRFAKPATSPVVARSFARRALLGGLGMSSLAVAPVAVQQQAKAANPEETTKIQTYYKKPKRYTKIEIKILITLERELAKIDAEIAYIEASITNVITLLNRAQQYTGDTIKGMIKTYKESLDADLASKKLQRKKMADSLKEMHELVNAN